MRVYIAAPWARKPEALVAANKFREAGFEVVSRWIEFHGDTDIHSELQQEAFNDLEDLTLSDILVVLNLQVSEGKAFEQGWWVGNKDGEIILVGEPSNVFHHLPNVRLVQSVEEAIDVVRDQG